MNTLLLKISIENLKHDKLSVCCDKLFKVGAE